MGKIAFVFPGQGAQVVGMGQNVYENSAVAKDVFEQASKAVDLDLKALCFEENNDINITEFTQVCLLTTSVAIMEELKTRGVKADVAAGLSLGEYCALVAAGSMNFVDAAKAVRKRGIFMQDCPIRILLYIKSGRCLMQQPLLLFTCYSDHSPV